MVPGTLGYAQDFVEEVLSPGTGLPCGLEQVTRTTLMLPWVFGSASVSSGSHTVPMLSSSLCFIPVRWGI